MKPHSALSQSPSAPPFEDTGLASALENLGEPVQLAAGDELWNVGGDPDFFVVACSALLASVDPERGAVTDIVTTGEIVGMEDVVAGRPREQRVHVLSAGLAVRVSADTVREGLTSGGARANDIFALGARAVRQAHARVREAGSGTVSARFARLILRIRPGSAESEPSDVDLPLGRSALAALVGCRPETLGRALRRGPLAAGVAVSRRGVRILDLAALEQCAAAGA